MATLLDKRGLLNGTKLTAFFTKELEVELELLVPLGVNKYEKLYLLLNDVIRIPSCKTCGKATSFIDTKKGFATYCSRLCSGSSLETKYKKEQAYLKRYGVKHPSMAKEVKAKKEQTYLRKYGVTNPSLVTEFQVKKKQTFIARYGVDNPMKDPEVAVRQRQSVESTLGVPNPSSDPHIKVKKAQTTFKNYGVDNPLQCKEVQNKQKETLLMKYGVDNIAKHPKVRQQSRLRRIREIRDNGGIVVNYNKIACSYFAQFEIDSNSSTGQYATKGTGEFFIQELGYFVDYIDIEKKIIIEWNESNHYRPARVQRYITRLKEIKSLFPDFTIYSIREDSFTLSGKSLFNYIQDINSKEYTLPYRYLRYLYSEEECAKDLKNILTSKGSLDKLPSTNKTVLTHQTEIYYAKENELWKDKEVRQKLVTNRMKYLNAEHGKVNGVPTPQELTDRELLRGFKISGIHRQGYSHFSPLWIKGFIEKYKVTSIYDPCGGWGHRLLGAWDVDYIYNDIDEDVTSNVRKIYNYAKSLYPTSGRKEFYSKDSSEFTPPVPYDAVFTCPPYFTVEEYSSANTSTTRFPDYSNWLNIWWRGTVKSSKANCTKYFSFVISKRFKEDMVEICIEEGLSLLEELPVGTKRGLHHFNNKTSHRVPNEYLVVLAI